MAGYLGNIPSAVPLTSADIADSIITSAKIANGTIAIADFSATGTPSASTFLRGDNAWGSAGASAGQVIQVVSTAKTDTFTTSTFAFTDLTGMSVSITPSSASNKVLILVSINASSVGDSSFLLFRNATSFTGDGAGSRTPSTFATGGREDYEQFANSFQYLDSPATTSAITYKIQCTALSNTLYINRERTDGDGVGSFRNISTITVMEIKG